MPRNDSFTLEVLLGKSHTKKAKEYYYGGSHYVEVEFLEKDSYILTEKVLLDDGDEEIFQWPVIPYQIRLSIAHHMPMMMYQLHVDGQSVLQHRLAGGDVRVYSGFNDGDLRKEFQFSYPRYGKSKSDKMSKHLCSDVGSIEVTCYYPIFMHRVFNNFAPKPRFMTYRQATKNDANTVTGGRYVMLTTRPGRNISCPRPAQWPYRDIFRRGDIDSRLRIKYRVKEALQDTGVIPTFRTPRTPRPKYKVPKQQPLTPTLPSKIKRVPVKRLPVHPLNEPLNKRVKLNENLLKLGGSLDFLNKGSSGRDSPAGVKPVIDKNKMSNTSAATNTSAGVKPFIDKKKVSNTSASTNTSSVASTSTPAEDKENKAFQIDLFRRMAEGLNSNDDIVGILDYDEESADELLTNNNSVLELSQMVTEKEKDIYQVITID